MVFEGSTLIEAVSLDPSGAARAHRVTAEGIVALPTRRLE
jgi:hypothetical protein